MKNIQKLATIVSYIVLINSQALTVDLNDNETHDNNQVRTMPASFTDYEKISSTILYADPNLLESPNIIGPKKILEPKYDWTHKPAQGEISSKNYSSTRRLAICGEDSVTYNGKKVKIKDIISIVTKGTNFNRRNAICGESQVTHKGHKMTYNKMLQNLKLNKNKI